MSTNKVLQILREHGEYTLLSYNILLHFVNISKLEYGIVRFKNMHKVKSKENLLSDFEPYEMNTLHRIFSRLQNWQILNGETKKLHSLLLSQHNFIINEIGKELSQKRVFLLVRICSELKSLIEFIEHRLLKELELMGITNCVIKIIVQDHESFLNVDAFNPKNMQIPFIQFLLENYHFCDLDECNVLYILVIYHRPSIQ